MFVIKGVDSIVRQGKQITFNFKVQTGEKIIDKMGYIDYLTHTSEGKEIDYGIVRVTLDENSLN